MIFCGPNPQTSQKNVAQKWGKNVVFYEHLLTGYCDMIGVCKSSGELADLLTRADKNLTSIEIVLMDWSATCVSLTL